VSPGIGLRLVDGKLVPYDKEGELPKLIGHLEPEAAPAPDPVSEEISRGGGNIRIRLADQLGRSGMTLTELADRVGIHLNNLSKLKTGDITFIRLATLSALCRELDCQPGDLLIYEQS
jgi:putative transcriptional regulator